jgi:hypothetical protein
MSNCEINRHECRSICQDYARAGFVLGAATTAVVVAALEFIVSIIF